MGAAAIWTCDGCGAKDENFNLDDAPKKWKTIKDSEGHFTEAHICERCYNGIFKGKKRRKAA